MNAVIIEDETVAVNSLKTILAQNEVTPVRVVAELESIEESVELTNLLLKSVSTFPTEEI